MEEQVKISIFGAAMLLASAGASAAPPQGQSAQEQPKDERKICRTERVTGSLTRRSRVCLTRAQWQELNDRTRKGFDDFVGAASGGCMAPSDVTKGTMC